MSSSSGATSPLVVEIDPELADLIPGYLSARRAEIPRLEEALHRQDFDLIESLGHKMRGTGASYGFSNLSELGLALEEAAQRQAQDKIHAAISQLRQYLERLQIKPLPSQPS